MFPTTSKVEDWAIALLDYAYSQKDNFTKHKIQFGKMGLTLHLPSEDPITVEIMDSLIETEDLESIYELMFWECSDSHEILSSIDVDIPSIPGGQHDLSDRTMICVDRHMNGLYILDRTSKRILVWVPSYQDFPFWARATPFRIPFSWIALENEGEMIHCAALEFEGHGVLLAGSGGRGKTTTAINAALEGARILGEDFILYMKNSVYAVYTKAKIHPGIHLNQLTAKGLKAPAAIADQKTIVSLRNQPFSMIMSFRPTILYFPGIPLTGNFTEIVKIPKGLALREFAGPSFIGLQGAGAKSLAIHSKLVKSVDSWSLAMTGQLDHDIASMKKHLQSQTTEL